MTLKGVVCFCLKSRPKSNRGFSVFFRGRIYEIKGRAIDVVFVLTMSPPKDNVETTFMCPWEVTIQTHVTRISSEPSTRCFCTFKQYEIGNYVDAMSNTDGKLTLYITLFANWRSCGVTLSKWAAAVEVVRGISLFRELRQWRLVRMEDGRS